MKLKKNFVLQEVGDIHMLASVGENVDFHGVVHCNPTATFLVMQLQEDKSEASLCESLMQRYSINRLQAQTAVDYVVKQLRSINALDD